MTPVPLVSAIVSSGDRPDALQRTLESLARQAPGELEIVVADHGPRGAGRAVASSFAPRLAIRYAAHGGGRAAARNGAVSLAGGEILLFLVEGAIADAGLLRAHAEAHGRSRAAGTAVLGPFELPPSLAADPLGEVLAGVEGSPFAPPAREGGEGPDLRRVAGACFSCRRSFVRAHGAFDPAFRSWGDDVELLYRLSRRGLEVVHEPAAVTVLDRLPTFDELCGASEREGAGRLLLSMVHADAAVRRWTEVAEAGPFWGRIGRAHDALVRSARELDRILRLRRAAGVALGDLDTVLVASGYWTALRACTFKGMIDEAARRGVDLVSAGAARDPEQALDCP